MSIMPELVLVALDKLWTIPKVIGSEVPHSVLVEKREFVTQALFKMQSMTSELEGQQIPFQCVPYARGSAYQCCIHNIWCSILLSCVIILGMVCCGSSPSGVTPIRNSTYWIMSTLL